jgi:hypothetical protein
MNKRLTKTIIALVSVVLVVAPAFAQGGNSITAQAFGVYDSQYITGAQANIWTAQQPGGWFVIASPVGVCTTNNTCTGNFFETGYLKGTITPVQNVLQQYVAYRTGFGAVVNIYGLGNLSDLTWYTFKVQTCGGIGQWCAYRNGSQVYSSPALSFSNGLSALCGGEGGGGGVPMGVECSNLKWRDMPYSGLNWWNYNYTKTQINSLVPPHQYCVTKPYDYGSISWKCQ